MIPDPALSPAAAATAPGATPTPQVGVVPGAPAVGDQLGEARRHLYERLGWCLIRLQQVEVGMKWLASRTEIELRLGDPIGDVERHAERFSRRTLGSVTQSVSTGLLRLPDWEPSLEGAPDAQEGWVRMGMVVELQPEHLDAVRARWADLVERRNVVVHGLLSNHDIWTAEGCVAALDYVEGTIAACNVVLAEVRDVVAGLTELGEKAARSRELQQLMVGLSDGLDALPEADSSARAAIGDPRADLPIEPRTSLPRQVELP